MKYGLDMNSMYYVVSEAIKRRIKLLRAAEDEKKTKADAQDALVEGKFEETGLYVSWLVKGLAQYKGDEMLKQLKELTKNKVDEGKLLEILAFMEDNGMIEKQGWTDRFREYKKKAETEREEAEARKLFYYIQLPVISVMSSIIFIFAFGRIRKAWREKMKRKKEELEKIADKYRERFRALYPKLEQAKTEEEVEKAHKEESALYDEIHKNYNAKDAEKLLWILAPTGRIFTNMYFTHRFRITGKKGWRVF